MAACPMPASSCYPAAAVITVWYARRCTPQQVGVSVPRILLDHVDKQVAQGERTVLQRYFTAEVDLLESVEPFVGFGGSALPNPLNGSGRRRDRRSRSASEWRRSCEPLPATEPLPFYCLWGRIAKQALCDSLKRPRRIADAQNDRSGATQTAIQTCPGVHSRVARDRASGQCGGVAVARVFL
jgi:hypothetical protein